MYQRKTVLPHGTINQHMANLAEVLALTFIAAKDGFLLLRLCFVVQEVPQDTNQQFRLEQHNTAMMITLVSRRCCTNFQWTGLKTQTNSLGFRTRKRVIAYYNTAALLDDLFLDCKPWHFLLTSSRPGTRHQTGLQCKGRL